MFILVAKKKAKKEIAGFKVQQGSEGICFHIEPDEAMQQAWQRFYKTAEARNISEKEIPEIIKTKFLKPGEEKVLFFNKEEQTPNFVLQVVLRNKKLLEKKNRKLAVLLMKLAIDQHCMFSEILWGEDVRGEPWLKTVVLVGDETTGLLHYL
jgi:hypothetical protein